MLADRTPSQRKTILVPNKYSHIQLSKLKDDNEDHEFNHIPRFKELEEDFLSMVNIALILRSEILSQPGQKGLSVDENDAIVCVPENLYKFVRLIF